MKHRFLLASTLLQPSMRPTSDWPTLPAGSFSTPVRKPNRDPATSNGTNWNRSRGRLSNVSSEESVTQLAESIAPWIGGSSSRATRPDDAADPSVPFDVSTAQISDVLKQEEGGDVQYVAVMVDAAGRTQQTPLDAADGESLYDVFQLMKKFPLLKTVYRKTVMGLLDRLVEEDRATADDSPPADEPGEAKQQNEN